MIGDDPPGPTLEEVATLASLSGSPAADERRSASMRFHYRGALHEAAGQSEHSHVFAFSCNSDHHAELVRRVLRCTAWRAFPVECTLRRACHLATRNLASGTDGESLVPDYDWLAHQLADAAGSMASEFVAPLRHIIAAAAFFRVSDGILWALPGRSAVPTSRSAGPKFYPRTALAHGASAALSSFNPHHTVNLDVVC